MSGWVIGYYWNVQSLDAIRVLPKQIMIACLVYVLVQILKRFVQKERHWWDWLYYVGLISAMLPTFLVSSKNEDFFHILTDFGAPFLFIPVVLDLYTLIRQK
jgi:hypothetical protein